MPLDKEYKKKLLKKLTLRISEGLEKQEISTGQASIIASYILNDFDNLNSQFQLNDFLAKMADKWEVFADIYSTETGKEKQENDVKTAKKVEQMIKENKIDGALNLSKEAVNKNKGEN
ncbi:hypothetical protein ACFLZ1_00505 [Patescibacteria group bacterium]